MGRREPRTRRTPARRVGAGAVLSAALVVLVALVSGCTGSAADAPPTSAPTTAQTVPLAQWWEQAASVAATAVAASGAGGDPASPAAAIAAAAELDELAAACLDPEVAWETGQLAFEVRQLATDQTALGDALAVGEVDHVAELTDLVAVGQQRVLDREAELRLSVQDAGVDAAVAGS